MQTPCGGFVSFLETEMLIDIINGRARETQAIEGLNSHDILCESDDCRHAMESKGGRRTRRFLERMMTMAGDLVLLVSQPFSDTLKALPEHQKLALRQAWAQVLGEVLMEGFAGIVAGFEVETFCEAGFEEYSQVGLLVRPGVSTHEASLWQLRQLLRLVDCMADMAFEVYRVLEADSHYAPFHGEVTVPDMHARVAKAHSRILEHRRRQAYNAKRREKRATERAMKGVIEIHGEALATSSIPSINIKASEEHRLAA